LEFNVPFQHKYGYIRDENTNRKPKCWKSNTSASVAARSSKSVIETEKNTSSVSRRPSEIEPWLHVNRKSLFVSDIAIFVLKRDVKLQLTN